MTDKTEDSASKPKVSKEQIEAIMARWNTYAWSIGLDEDNVEYITREREFVFGAVTQILNCTVSEVLMTDLPPAVAMCLMSWRPLSSVYPANPESVRLRGGR